MKRFATANWKGTGKEGVGTVNTETGVVSQANLTFRSRFEDGAGTNPEELVAAAHAGCFSMTLSFVLNAAGFTAENIDTKCTVTLLDGSITESHLDVTVSVPGLEDEEKFAAIAKEAKENCPVSKLLKANITMDASLV